MRRNRSMPRSHVVPVLAYPDVGKAIDWLCGTFGFTLRWRIGTHRAQLKIGSGTIAVVERRSYAGRPKEPGQEGDSVMVRVEDVDSHYARARRHRARIREEPADFPYGERQYSVEDLAGHLWTFSESIADVAPEEWGGTSGDLEDA